MPRARPIVPRYGRSACGSLRVPSRRSRRRPCPSAPRPGAPAGLRHSLCAECACWARASFSFFSRRRVSAAFFTCSSSRSKLRSSIPILLLGCRRRFGRGPRRSRRPTPGSRRPSTCGRGVDSASAGSGSPCPPATAAPRSGRRRRHQPAACPPARLASASQPAAGRDVSVTSERSRDTAGNRASGSTARPAGRRRRERPRGRSRATTTSVSRRSAAARSGCSTPR